MDWQIYKKRCDQPNVFSRWMLKQTIELLGPEQQTVQQAELLSCVLLGQPLTKPTDHLGDERTDMFILNMEMQDVSAIYQLIVEARISGRSTQDTQSRGLAGFDVAWGEYLASID